MPDIPAGSEFVSMSVRFRGFVDATHPTDYFRFQARQNGTTTRTDDIDSTSSSLRDFDGDASYWGFTGTAQDIIDDLADGSIKWRFETKGVAGTATRRDVRDFQVQLTYAEPATEGALLGIIP